MEQKVKTKYFGEITVSRTMTAAVPQQISFFKNQFLPEKQRIIDSREMALAQKKEEGIPTEHQHKVDQYIKSTNRKKEEIVLLNQIFENSVTCAQAADAFIYHSESLQKHQQVASEMQQLLEKLSIFVDTLEEMGVVKNQELNVAPTKLQLRGCKEATNDLWKFLKQTIS